MNKKTIRDICTSNIISIQPGTKISEAMAIMRSRNISCVVVLEKEKPIGILTERNLVTFAANRAEVRDTVEVRELMSSPVLTTTQDADIYDAYNLLFTKNLRHLVVVDDRGHATGVVTQSNIVEHLSYDSFIEMKKVSQVMSRVVHTLTSDVSVQRALRDMSEKSMSCLIVVENNLPAGILTERDVARLLVEKNDIFRMTLAEVMSTPVQTVFTDTPLLEAVELMQNKKMRRLVVVDQQGAVIGLATQTDVVKGLEGKYIERLNQLIAEKDHVIENTTRDLAETTIYLDNILNSAVDLGIIAVDLDYRVAYFNPGAELVLGIRAGEAAGNDVRNLKLCRHEDMFRIDEVVSALGRDKRYAYTIERNRDSEIQYLSIMASRINDIKDNMIGYLLMFNDTTKRKLAEDQLLNSRQILEERVQERTSDLKRAMYGAIQAIALTVEMRDPYTSGHQRRVADLAESIGREMDLPGNQVEGIYMAALTHDIGKIRVPSGILCHPGKLGEAEFAIIKPHPQIGYNILKGIKFPWPLAEIVLQHHEKLNGTGYPSGLRGEEILLEARILTVADVVEAMSSHRPYRPELGIKMALEEIVRYQGEYFDPDVVNVCLRLFIDMDYKLPASSTFI